MIVDLQGAAYILAVAAAIGSLPSQHLTDLCPDCGRLLLYSDNDEHIAVGVSHLPGATRDIAVVITCHGNWAINPALVGLTLPNWHPAPQWPNPENEE